MRDGKKNAGIFTVVFLEGLIDYASPFLHILNEASRLMMVQSFTSFNNICSYFNSDNFVSNPKIFNHTNKGALIFFSFCIIILCIAMTCIRYLSIVITNPNWSSSDV